MKIQRGFSLIELLMVIVIIGVVAAIAMPNLVSARRAANEASAVSSLRILCGATASYAATVGAGNYPGTPSTVGTTSLADLRAAHLIDEVLGQGEKSGYSFLGDHTLAGPGVLPTFYFAANPISPSGLLMSGTQRFGVATDGVIRSDATAANLATPFDAITLMTAQPISNP